MFNTDVSIQENKDYGPGISWQNCFFYWRLPLHKTTIILDRFRKKIDHFLNLLAAIIVIFGVSALLLWYYINLELLIEQPFSVLPFWLHQHPLLLFFLLAVWVALFLLYRRSELNVKAKKIHREWLEANRDYVENCRKTPLTYNQSHDFDRTVEWEELPEFRKQEYIRIARYRVLTGAKC